MAYGAIPWDCRTVAEITAFGVDPMASITQQIDDQAAGIGQSRRQVAARVAEIIDSFLASHITFGRPGNETFYIGKPPNQHITAEPPLAAEDEPALSTNELSLAINENSDAHAIILSATDVDGLIFGLVRWRASHSDAAAAPEGTHPTVDGLSSPSPAENSSGRPHRNILQPSVCRTCSRRTL
ncbi:hypothetical protein C5E45_20575 [Nocardia nova]|uniref:Uncharacterized protein n=2 Tax=Nocardia nova TaxID=37330 RepID=A0A2S6AMJ0_9NOCA|nr:hypothetical protein C5E45_20575 [Nocardia nova]